MARIRTIKPDFWTDGNMVKLSPFARLLYIGMWNFTLCDHGHVADDAMKLKLQILPMDNVDIDELLAEVMEQGRVVRVSDGDGRTYLLVRRFEDHQKIDPRWKTRCPACAQQDSLAPIETPVSFTEPQRDSPQLPLGRDGMGRDGKNTRPPAPPKDDSDALFDAWYSSYPRKEAKGAARKAFKAALKKTDIETLHRGLTAYKASIQGKEKTYIALPGSWLNAERWEDDYTDNQEGGDPWAALRASSTQS